MKNQVDEVLAKSIRKFLKAQYGQFQDRVVPDTGASCKPQDRQRQPRGQQVNAGGKQ